MTRKCGLLGLIAGAGLLLSTGANAAVVTLGGVAAGDGSGLTSFYGTTYNFDTSFAAISAGNLETGSSSGQYAAPNGDSTQYYTVGSFITPQTATLTLGGNSNYLGLLWGSVDDYNSITLHLANGGTEVISSSTQPLLNPANGNQGPGGTSYVNIYASDYITSIDFLSGKAAFEFDNVTVAAVPEPATWAMMMLGFLGLGFLGYRKSSKTGGASFRLA